MPTISNGDTIGKSCDFWNRYSVLKMPKALCQKAVPAWFVAVACNCALDATLLCRFEEDLALARDIGSNAFRFSIEWSKIEPRRGEIDRASVARYHQIINCIKK